MSKVSTLKVLLILCNKYDIIQYRKPPESLNAIAHIRAPHAAYGRSFRLRSGSLRCAGEAIGQRKAEQLSMLAREVLTLSRNRLPVDPRFPDAAPRRPEPTEKPELTNATDRHYLAYDPMHVLKCRTTSRMASAPSRKRRRSTRRHSCSRTTSTAIQGSRLGRSGWYCKKKT